MRVVAILQARMNSSRLLGKMFLPLLGKPLVQHVIERVQRATTLTEVVLAIPLKDFDAFAPIASEAQTWLYPFSGNEADVVGRYMGAAMLTDADLIVRVPCDNPCVDPKYIDWAVGEYLSNPYIYFSNTTIWMMAQNITIDGLGVEVFSVSRLKWLDMQTQGFPELREHPHRLFEERGILRMQMANVRLDVNTQADYEFIKDIYDHFQRNDFTAAEIVAYLESKKVPA